MFKLLMCPYWISMSIGEEFGDIQIYGEHCHKPNLMCIKLFHNDDIKCDIIKVCKLGNRHDLWKKEECRACNYRYLCVSLVHSSTITEEVERMGKTAMLKRWFG